MFKKSLHEQINDGWLNFLPRSFYILAVLCKRMYLRGSCYPGDRGLALWGWKSWVDKSFISMTPKYNGIAKAIYNSNELKVLKIC